MLIYASLLFPLTAAATQVSTISLRSTFTEVVPKTDTAAALAALDVLMSAVGVCSPIFAGFAFDGVPPAHQPRVAAVFHVVALLVVLATFAPPPKQHRAKTDDESKKEN